MAEPDDRSQAGGDSLEATHTAGLPAGPESSATVPKEWGGLRVVEELGHGGGGRVYRAFDPALARDVALKIIRVPSPERGAALLREGQLLARVQHPNVVVVYGARQIGDEIGLWMELVRGRSLSDLVRQDGPMGPEEATVIGMSLCRALAAVHGAGLIHRDVKAHNVMRESGGRIVLMDFGIGRDLADEGRPASADLSGTPAYMAPELFRGDLASASSDLYSLGVLLFFLVTRQYPVDGRSVTEITLAHSLGTRRHLADYRPDLPDGFVRVLDRALSPKPGDRSPSAGAMMRELAEAAEGSAAGARAPASTTAGVPFDRPRGRTAAAARWAGALIGLFLAIGALGFLMCTAFDLTLERGAEFSDFTAVHYLKHGAQSLFAPLVLTTIAVLVVGVMTAAGNIVRRAWPWARQSMDRVASGLVHAASRAGFSDRQSLAQALMILQALAVGAVLWRFRALLSALTGYVSSADAATLAMLGPEATEPLTYRAVLTLLIAAMVFAWYRLLSRRPGDPPIGRPAIAGGFAVIGLAVLMLEVPYMLFIQNDRPRSDFGTTRCYRIGARDDEVLLYCPDGQPRVRVVSAGDPQLQPVGTLESIFR